MPRCDGTETHRPLNSFPPADPRSAMPRSSDLPPCPSSHVSTQLCSCHPGNTPDRRILGADVGELSSWVPQDCYCWRDRSWQDPIPGHCTVSKQIDTPSLPGKEAGQPAQWGPQRARGERGWGRHTPASVEPTWFLQKGRSTHLRGPDFGSCYQTTRLHARLWCQTRALGFHGTRTSRESS